MKDFENVVRLIAERIRRTENVVVGDVTHADPDVFRYVSNPWALKQYRDAGVTDLLLEIPKQDYDFIVDLQKQGLDRAAMAEAMRQHRFLSATLPREAGTEREWVDRLTDIAYHSQQLGIRLHYDPSVEDGERYAMDRLDPETKTLLQTFFDERNAGRRSDHSMTDREKIAHKEYLGFRHEYRSSIESDKASPADLAVVNGMRDRGIGKGSILAFFGVGHLLGRRDLDELLTDLNHLPTTTVVTDIPSYHDIVQRAINLKKGDVGPPNFINNPQTAALHSIPTTLAGEEARSFDGWLRASKEVDVASLGALPSPLSSPMLFGSDTSRVQGR